MMSMTNISTPVMVEPTFISTPSTFSHHTIAVGNHVYIHTSLHTESVNIILLLLLLLLVSSSSSSSSIVRGVI